MDARVVQVDQQRDLPLLIQPQAVIEEIIVILMSDEVVSNLEKPLVAVVDRQSGGEFIELEGLRGDDLGHVVFQPARRLQRQVEDAGRKSPRLISGAVKMEIIGEIKGE